MLSEYVAKHAKRGACTCGECIDAPPDSEQYQPTGHTADLVFFRVAKDNEANADAFMDLVKTECPHWLDGEEHSYLEMGGDMGDQGIALMTMGLGYLLGCWELLTPANMLPVLGHDEMKKLAGLGMITIRA